jgi:2-oxoglutarate dehydrogenase complex dehydrogenase (E1) component-like enzyme
VCNATTPGQYFHLLRRQVKVGFRKPLILMTPKSLLRHPKVISTINDLAEGGFREVLDDSYEPHNISRILLCSGKIYYDLLDRREAVENTDTALIRLEQLYPFPEQALDACFERYSHLRDVTWIQEEPRNYGAWSYMSERFRSYWPAIDLHYLGRDESSSSATGSFKQHEAEQKKLIEEAFGLSKSPAS